jgi:hypothetical protein
VQFVSSDLLLLTSLLCHLIYRLHLANMVWDLAYPRLRRRRSSAPRAIRDCPEIGEKASDPENRR